MSELPPENPTEKLLDESGDEGNFRQLFDDVSPGLRRFLASRLDQICDVEDCLQAVFVAMVQHGGNVGVASRRAWLFRVAANESARFWRKKSATDKMLAANRRSDVAQSDPAEPIIREETLRSIRAAIEGLTSEYRDIIQLRIHENLTFQQIADKRNIPLGTALTRMRRALDQLRNQFEPDEE